MSVMIVVVTENSILRYLLRDNESGNGRHAVEAFLGWNLRPTW